MATNLNLEAYGSGGDGRSSKITGISSQNDVTVNTTVNTTGGWTTASVTADLQRRFYLTAAAGATAGMPEGWYENVGPVNGSNLFRKM